MTFEGALIEEQGVQFGVVSVKQHVVNNRTEAQRVIRAFGPVFPRVPVVLVSVDSRGSSQWIGRQDIVNYMANVPLAAIPWAKYTVS